MGEPFPVSFSSGSVIKGLTALVFARQSHRREEGRSTYFALSVSPGLCRQHFTCHFI